MGKTLSRGMVAADYSALWHRTALEHDLREASAARVERARYIACVVCGVALGLGVVFVQMIIGA